MKKNWGTGWARFGRTGPVPPGPNLEPPRSVIRFRDLYRLRTARAVSDNKAVRWRLCSVQCSCVL